MSNAADAGRGEVFRLKLWKTYYNQGFFNIRHAYDHNVGEEGLVKLMLGGDGQIQGHVDRRSQRNGTARIIGGTALRDWFQATYSEGDTVPVRFEAPIASSWGSVENSALVHLSPRQFPANPQPAAQFACCGHRPCCPPLTTHVVREPNAELGVQGGLFRRGAATCRVDQALIGAQSHVLHTVVSSGHPIVSAPGEHFNSVHY